MKAFENTGGQDYVNVVTNLPIDEWSYVLSEEDASGWCHVTKSEEDDKLIINVDANTGMSVRSVEITVTSDGIDATKYPKIAIMQAGAASTLLLVEGSSTRNFQAGGGSETVNIITSNISADKWEFALSNSSDASWCHVTKITGNQLRILVSENTGTSTRSAEITVTSSLVPAAQQPKITVTQAPISYELTIEKNSTWYFQAGGGSETVNIVTSNIPADKWGYELSNPSASSWCDVTKNNNRLIILVSANTETNERSVDITVTSSLMPAAQQPTFTVKQAAVSQQPGGNPGVTGAHFSIKGYVSQAITVKFTDNTTSQLTLDGSGEGVLAAGNGAARTIRSIQAAGGSEIFIGRKEDSGDIKLEVNNHVVQWRKNGATG
ncbi:MAG: hypothetical protein EZS28_047691, partial [Streblomastix strix]